MMTAPTISANAGSITAEGSVGDINSNNTINVYRWDPGEHRSQAFEQYTEGTLLWVLEEAEFKAWLGDGGMLWCPGEPGAGKTVFSSFVIHHLQNHPNAIVCYIYHRYDTTRSTLQVFEAILRQLILRCPSVNIDRIEAAKNQDRRLTLKEILSILQETFARVPDIFVVLDAFDECFDEPTRYQVLHHLQSFHSVNTLITSRRLPSIEGPMGTARRLDIFAHSEDIKTHFRAQKDFNPTLAKLVSRVSDTDVEGKLVEKADGRFLLAGLHTRNLAAQTNISQFRHALETLPQEVTASYEETLDRIRHQDPPLRRLAFHTLSWIYYALRPLSLSELIHALATHDLDRMAKEEDLTDEETVISSCAGLVVVNRSTVRLREIVTVSFLHYTVQEFLQQARAARDFLSDIEIALQCMKVVSFPGIRFNPPYYPLIDHAVSVWGTMVRRHEPDETVFKLALSQLDDAVTIRILGDGPRYSEFPSYTRHDFHHDAATAIHFAADYGLVRIIKTLMGRTPAAINQRDREGRTALIWAARNGHLGVVEELVTQPNIYVDLKYSSGRTPLSWAAWSGHLQVVRVLLSHFDANVNLKDHHSDRTPLSWAVQGGHLRVVKELLTHPNVNVNSADKFGWTPFALAVIKGDLGFVKEFLCHPNVEVDSQDQDACTPFSWAAAYGHLEVVKQLLHHPAVEVDSKDKYGYTPLCIAAMYGRLEVVRELLDHSSVDINSSDDQYGSTPLSRAAAEGHLEVVMQLLTHPNVNVNSKSKNGRTPLSRAAEGGHLGVVKELLNHSNVDVNSKDDCGCTPLVWAVRYGHLEITKLFVNVEHVDINSRETVWGLTPLLYATHFGHLAVVELLLNTGKIVLLRKRAVRKRLSFSMLPMTRLQIRS